MPEGHSDTGAESRGSVAGWVGGGACAVLATIIAVRVALDRGLHARPLLSAAGSLLLLLLPFFLFGTTPLIDRLKVWLFPAPWRAIGPVSLVVFLPFGVYAIGTGTFSLSALALLAVVALVPMLALLWARRAGPPPRWEDGLAILAIWLPFEMRWVLEPWPWDSSAGGYVFGAVLAVDLAVVLFVAMRGIEGVGYRFVWTREDLPAFLSNLGIFLSLGIPIGLATGFIAWNRETPDLLRFAAAGFGIFVVIAVPEEFLFRGLIQNLLAKRLPTGWALTVTSILFGASHLNNGPSPDWRYFVLATLAAVFYGRAYLRTGGLLAPSLVHAAVDAIWGEFFR